MTAKLLQGAGVFMGENMPVTAEDPQFAHLLRDVRPNQKLLKNLVEERNSAHRRWGFKAPFRNHWDFLATLDRARFVVVFRDVLAVANRNRISAEAELLPSMLANIELERNILKFVSATKQPVMLFSYEKALIAPREVSVAMLDFVGMPKHDVAVENLVKIIQPNEPAYVKAQDPAHSKLVLHVDILSHKRIAGWGRKSNGSVITIGVEVNGKVVAETKADLFRQDLAKRFGHGNYAFDIGLERELAPGSEITIRSGSEKSILYRAIFNG